MLLAKSAAIGKTLSDAPRAARMLPSVIGGPAGCLGEDHPRLNCSVARVYSSTIHWPVLIRLAAASGAQTASAARLPTASPACSTSFVCFSASALSVAPGLELERDLL